MAERICPWWLGYFLLSPLRRLAQDPSKLLHSYVHAGMTVLEPGPGMGFFTMELARLVGPSGRVVAVDVQPIMLDRLKRRAAKRNLSPRIDARLAQSDSMGVSDLKGKIDFVLAFAMVHELPPSAHFFAEALDTLKPGGCILLAEPRGHVKPDRFTLELKSAAQAGLEVVDHPSIRHSHAVLLRKPAAA